MRFTTNLLIRGVVGAYQIKINLMRLSKGCVLIINGFDRFSLKLSFFDKINSLYHYS